jgi:[acyl-carrier-protein] S-malonyltransferase
LGLDDNKVADICAASSTDTQIVAPANYNCPGQIVIAGHKEAVEKAGAACKESGARRAQAIPVNVPSHCELMKPAAVKLAEQLASLSFCAPQIPVLNNVDVSYEADGDMIKDALVRQLYKPVRWTETAQRLANEGVTHFYEVGPGKVLSGLVKRIAKETTIVPLNTLDAIQERN